MLVCTSTSYMSAQSPASEVQGRSSCQVSEAPAHLQHAIAGALDTLFRILIVCTVMLWLALDLQDAVLLQSQKVKGEGKKRIVAVLPPGDDSNSTEVLNSVNKGLGLREWLESKGHEYIVTAEKDPGQGMPMRQIKLRNMQYLQHCLPDS